MTTGVLILIGIWVLFCVGFVLLRWKLDKRIIKTPKCIKYESNNWEKKQSGFRNIHQYKKCKYIFDWLDYITESKVSASTITASEIDASKLLDK